MGEWAVSAVTVQSTLGRSEGWEGDRSTCPLICYQVIHISCFPEIETHAFCLLVSAFVSPTLPVSQISTQNIQLWYKRQKLGVSLLCI